MTETQQEHPPVRVHVVADTSSIPARPHSRLVTRFGTETVDAVNTVRPLLPAAPERVCAYVQVTGADVYLCATEGKAIAAAGTPNSELGTLLPHGNTAPWPVHGQQAVWIAQASAFVPEVTPANPSAGASYSWVNTTGVPQALVSVAAKLVTSSAAANRFLSVQILDAAGNLVAEQTDGTALTATTTTTLFYAMGLANNPNATGTTLGGLPQVTIQPGWTVMVKVSAIDAGDQLSNIVLTFAGSSLATVSYTADYAIAE